MTCICGHDSTLHQAVPDFANLGACTVYGCTLCQAHGFRPAPLPSPNPQPGSGGATP